MPSGDRTGPEGRGPVTGRGLGYCTGYDSPGFTKGMPRGRGYGRGWGQGFGRGFRNRGFWYRRPPPEQYYEPTPRPYYRESYREPNPEDEKHYIEQMIKDLEEELKSMRDRLQELSKQKKSPE